MVVSNTDNKKAVMLPIFEVGDRSDTKCKMGLIQQFTPKVDFTYFSYLDSTISTISLQYVNST